MPSSGWPGGRRSPEEGLSARLDPLTRHLGSAKARAPRTVLEYKQRLQERIRELTDGLEMDPARLSQGGGPPGGEKRHHRGDRSIREPYRPNGKAPPWQRCHRTQARRPASGDGSAGDSLRSKSNDIAIAQDVIELKSELAKLRDQAQNVE